MAGLPLTQPWALAATEEVLNDSGTHHQCSPDLAKDWEISKGK
jgi:hypothetical protein